VSTFIKRRTAKGELRYMARIHGVGAKTFTTMADARLWAGEMERRKRLGELYEAPVESFGEFLDSYLARKRTGWKESTILDRKQLTTYLAPLRRFAVKDLDRATVEDLIASVASHAPRRAQKALALVKAVLKDAMLRKQRVDQSILTIPNPKYTSRTPRILTLDEVNTIASWMPDFIKRIVPIAALTGLRQGELFNLVDNDLHLDEGWLQVQSGKTAASRRRVNIGSEVVKLFREQLMVRPHTDFVFPAYEGGNFNRNNFGHRFYRPARLAAGIPEVNFHDLRSTYASLMIRAKVDIRTIAGQMGHADGGAMLLKKYGFLYDDAGERGAALLDALVRAE
jgi:integrase